MEFDNKSFSSKDVINNQKGGVIGGNVHINSDVAYTGASGSFTVGKTVTGGTSGATGEILTDNGSTMVVANNIDNKQFTNGETITESDTGITATVNGAPTATKYSIDSWIFKKPDKANSKMLIYTGARLTQIPSTLYTSSTGTWLRFDPTTNWEAGNVIQSTDDSETLGDIVNLINFGRLGHFDFTNISATFNYKVSPYTVLTPREVLNQKRKGTAREDGSGLITANGTNLKIDLSAETYFRIGAGGDGSDPSVFTEIDNPYISADTQITIRPVFNGGSGFAKASGVPTTDLDPTHYDDSSGTLATVGNNQYVNLYIILFPDTTVTEKKTVFMCPGYSDYGSLASAEAVLGTKEDFEIIPGMDGGIILCAISIKKETTELTTAIAGGTASITNTNSEGKFE